MSKITSLKKPINSDAVLAFAEGAQAAKTATARVRACPSQKTRPRARNRACCHRVTFG